MKKRNGLLIFGVTVIGIIMLAGCNELKEATYTTKPSSSVGINIRDSEITIKVEDALHSDKEFNSLDITVATLKGDVLLTGVVENQSQIYQAGKLIRSIEGVHTIHDHLSVRK